MLPSDRKSDGPAQNDAGMPEPGRNDNTAAQCGSGITYLKYQLAAIVALSVPLGINKSTVILWSPLLFFAFVAVVVSFRRTSRAARIVPTIGALAYAVGTEIGARFFPGSGDWVSFTLPAVLFVIFLIVGLIAATAVLRSMGTHPW